MFGGHQDFESDRDGLISPPNCGGTGGRALDYSVSVYAGEPGLAAPPCPLMVMGTKNAVSTATTARIRIAGRRIFLFFISWLPY
jgi:hypothetical protein